MILAETAGCRRAFEDPAIPVCHLDNLLARLLQGYGERAQYSVCECVLDEDQHAALRRRMERLVNAQEDSVRFYRLGPARQAAAAVEVLGLGRLTERPVVYL